MNTKNSIRLMVLSAALLLLAACGIEGDSWAGISASENDDVLVSYQKFIARLTPEGERLWLYPTPDNRDADIYASAVVDGGTVYVGDYKGGVHAVDFETGEQVWRYEQGGTTLFGFINFGGTPDRVIGAVALSETLVFVPDEQGVFALDRATGERLDDWKVETDRAVWSQPLYIPASEDQDSILYVTALDHSLYAINPETADVIWQTDLGGAAPGNPILSPDGNTLFVGTFSSEVVALDPENGDVLSRYETEGWVWEPPTIDDTTLYFSDLDGYLYAVEYNNGAFSQLWKEQITEEGKLRARPLLVGDLLIVASDNQRVYAVSRSDGAIEWDENIEREVVSPLVPITLDGETLVIIATDNVDELLRAIQVENGNERWTYAHKDD